ncbi:hypothetical protein EV122DRAFT_194414, partial [Schizophyllum commune]
RPEDSLPTIMRCAIQGSPQQRLTVRGIYAALQDKYAYFRTADPTWKSCVRHHLSRNLQFERVPRAPCDGVAGHGSYWTVN